MFGRKKSGFTLIELLVVIAIIAILAAILFPVFAKAKEQARKSTCQSNLKECIIALQTYYTDFDSMFPSSWISFVSDGNSNTTATVPDQAHEELFCFGYDSGNTGKDVLPPLGGDIMVTWAQMLYNDMKSKDIMFCPSDQVNGQTFAAHTANYDKNAAQGQSLSYWWKWSADQAWNNPNVHAKKESDYPYNSDYVILYEHAGWHFGDATGIRFGTEINVAYLDSHVRTVTIKYAQANGLYAQYPADVEGNPSSPAYPDYDEDNTLNAGVNQFNPSSPPASDPYAMTPQPIDPHHFADQF